MSTQPAYAALPILEVASISVANTERIYSAGNVTTLITGEAPGTRVERILMQASAATTAGVLRLWCKETTGGTWALLAEILVDAITPSTTVAAWTDEYAPTLGINLGLGHMLGISTNNAETFNVFVFGGRL